MKPAYWMRLCVSFFTLLVLDSATAASFTAFESGHVRPLAISSSGDRLFAVNTPDNHLEIFSVTNTGLTLESSVPVGLEPVAVGVRNDDEVWVINHLSDSISIVDVAASPPRVIRTLFVGDEPRDIVFAGINDNRAFITTAHRGQNSPYTSATNPGELTTPGTGRADVWVFDSNSPGSALGGTPLTIITLFGDTPRPLAVSPNGSTVYAGIYHSGNKTTIVHEEAVCDGGATEPSCFVDGATAPGGLPLPNESSANAAQPEVALIVKNNGTNWVDELGRQWDGLVRFDLPDLDVFAINALANPPVEIDSYASAGTILSDIAIHPGSGKLFVANTEAINEVRFEGTRTPGQLIDGVEPTSVVGHLHETRITVIDPSTGSVTPRHLNKHIDYSINPAPAGVADKSLAIPRQLVISTNGSTLYLAAKGSDKVGVFETAKIENDSFVPDSANHISVSGGGPSGLLLDESRNRLYVTTRFDNGLSIIDLPSQTESDHYLLHNPEPASITDGRRFLYDARFTSSNGEAACASCHVDGDLDSLAWDLGDPTGAVLNNPLDMIFAGGENTDPNAGDVLYQNFHPMKGPMTTQTLRGMNGHGSMHWRGDRTGGNDEPNMEPDSGAYNEDLAFKKFNVAFEGLLGRSGPLTATEMQQYTDFILQLLPPPNPIRALDNSLTPKQSNGRNFYFNTPSILGTFTCNSCHVIDEAQGFFGTGGRANFENETQHFKIAQLRNIYSKVGMFGMPAVPFFNAGDNAHKGDQIRGFGFVHDGSTDTILRFLNATPFDFPGGDTQRGEVEQFLFALDSNLKPVIGQHITLTDINKVVVNPRIDLLIARSAAGDADLIVKGTINGELRGWHRKADGTFQSDKSIEPALSDTQLRALASTPSQPLTYMAVPVGSAVRSGIDRDEDTLLDGDDNCPAVASPDLLDTDGDGEGNVCDIDDDNDGLTDNDENAMGTDPLLTDTDGDGLSDGSEVNTHGTDPLLTDTDADGLSDSEEISLGTNPLASNRGDLAPRGMPNGVLDIADVLVMNRILLGVITASPTETTLGDLNDSGSLDIGDQVILLRMVTGAIPAP